MLSSSVKGKRSENLILYPVILRVPQSIRLLKGRPNFEALGRHARQSLRISGQRSGFYPEKLLKGKSGEPLSCGGVHWSISHKPDFVAGIVSLEPVGIDIERVKPVTQGVFEKILTLEEAACFGNCGPLDLFFRAFTAKEALLKLRGVGLAGLSGVKVVGVPEANLTLVQYQGDVSTVEHFWVDGHICSVVRKEADLVWECVNPFPVTISRKARLQSKKA